MIQHVSVLVGSRVARVTTAYPRLDCDGLAAEIAEACLTPATHAAPRNVDCGGPP